VDVSAVSQKAGTSKLILTDVEVGAVGQSLNQVGPDGKSVKVTKSVTIFLKPAQVEVLNAHAGSKGTVRLALRGQGDRAREESIWSHMFKGGTVAQATPSLGTKNHVVEVVRGSNVERLVFIESSRPGSYKLLETQESPGDRSRGKGRSDSGDRPVTEIGE
jgi:Flp pilus assembly protein CpaB